MALPRTSANSRREMLIASAVEVISREGLDSASTRRIAENANTSQGAFHYAFRSKDELLEALVLVVTAQVAQTLRDGTDTSRGLAHAVDVAVRSFWQWVISDDGLQMMQFELTMFCLRNDGFEELAADQYRRYTASAASVFEEAANCDPAATQLNVADLTHFLVAAMDGLIIQHLVHHDEGRCERDLSNIIRAALFIAGASPDPGRGAEVAMSTDENP